MKASLIITSYNQKDTVELLLASLSRQTEKDFEIVVADDGSSDASGHACEKAARRFRLALSFVTHEKQGYRKAKILNDALRSVKSDYLIFLDGDTIVEKHFIEDHLRLRKPGAFVCGRRVEMGPRFSQSIHLKAVLAGRFDRPTLGLIKSALRGETENANRSLRVVNPFLRKIFKYDRPIDILGSNFSAWRKDVESVNGFNEREGYWGEDGDLYIRLRNRGLKAIGAKAIAVQFHIFHSRREPSPERMAAYYEMLKNQDYVWAPHGLSKA